MSLNIFEIIEGIVDFICLLTDYNSSDSNNNGKKFRKKSKYTVKLWSGGFLLIASILFFIVFKNPLPDKDFVQSILVCVLIGLVLSFIVFFSLFHLGLYYFRSVFEFLLFSGTFILLMIALVLYVYFKSNLFSI
ncbi:branched-chain amino acid ABC transporter substrate-binding protein [Chryseobacterium aahli]|uniref:branched-chain amino acid ABC transporter substrate-binding protein n=1 Tax=Chryseobacterium aahli TaxID=1278643 RepID=UPI001F607634|nr:branched-chain amino acid ABC transporter substrate-binding protein [Chryseobacterium aahli]MCI3938659.1 branched-chain amino acid ABC transporter substrate-binding protein [Chryseobacterium aahli]